MRFAAKGSFGWWAVACVLLFATGAAAGQANDPMTFWDTPQHGANCFNEAPPDEAYYTALRATGATWVRLSFSKWKGTGRDFLIGNADHYDGIPKSDLAVLLQSLKAAQVAGMKVVVTPLSLPGNRWQQQNGDKLDDRLWKDKGYWSQSAMFWKDLAKVLKDQPAVVAYNVLNEPALEKDLGLEMMAEPGVQAAWYGRARGTAHDLPEFYAEVIAAIRSVDAKTPVMVDGGWYGNPQGFSYWLAALADGRTLYSFHMYDPYEATSLPNLSRVPPYRYPGVKIWFGPKEVVWDKSVVAQDLSAPFTWAKAHGVPANRMVAGEFGCVRRWADCGTYLTDVLDVLNGYRAHWAFYGFREDGWDGMDYELAPTVTFARFHELMGQGKGEMLQRTPHPLLDIIEQHMTLPAK